LERRCKEARIECVQWDSRRPHETASIVLVTPESAITKTFSTYINRLRGTYQLDRVFMDESHVILDSGPNFRPKLRALGAEMVQMGTQIIFLTATLPPQDEEEFFRAIQIPQECVHMFRGSTSRRNIQYRVHEVEEETVVEAISQMVAEKLTQYPAPSKIIVYGGSVDQTVEVGEALGCPIYHRDVDSRAGKAQRMKDLMEGKSRVISATNALGLGVDLPDVRVVIHAGAPPKLRDYAQESGRAGRDRQASEAIIVQRHFEHMPSDRTSRSWTRLDRKDMDDFVAGYHCRRVIMDRVMDGRMDRVECEEGEEACDVCQRSQESDLPMVQLPMSSSNVAPNSQEGLPELREVENRLATSDVRFEDSGIGNSMSSQADITMPDRASSPISEDQGFTRQSPITGRFSSMEERVEMETRFEQHQRERQWLASGVVRQRRREGQEIAEFEEQLQKWANKCALCRFQKRQQQQHPLEECQDPEAEMVVKMVQIMTEEICEKKRLAPFSSCYRCGIPQAICQRWKQKDEQGWFEKVEGVRCQYQGVVIPVVTVIWSKRDCTDKNIVGQWIEKDKVDIENAENVYRWFGQRVKWGGIEASRLCQVFHALTQAEIGF
jgi:superfamily II DNA helicase RecQ